MRALADGLVQRVERGLGGGLVAERADAAGDRHEPGLVEEQVVDVGGRRGRGPRVELLLERRVGVAAGLLDLLDGRRLVPTCRRGSGRVGRPRRGWPGSAARARGRVANTANDAVRGFSGGDSSLAMSGRARVRSRRWSSRRRTRSAARLRAAPRGGATAQSRGHRGSTHGGKCGGGRGDLVQTSTPAVPAFAGRGRPAAPTVVWEPPREGPRREVRDGSVAAPPRESARLTSIGDAEARQAEAEPRPGALEDLDAGRLDGDHGPPVAGRTLRARRPRRRRAVGRLRHRHQDLEQRRRVYGGRLRHEGVTQDSLVASLTEAASAVALLIPGVPQRLVKPVLCAADAEDLDARVGALLVCSTDNWLPCSRRGCTACRPTSSTSPRVSSVTTCTTAAWSRSPPAPATGGQEG